MSIPIDDPFGLNKSSKSNILYIPGAYNQAPGGQNNPNQVTSSVSVSDKKAPISASLVKDIANGKYGNGKKRAAKVTAMGYTSSEVKSEVNAYVKAHPEYGTAKKKTYGGTSKKSTSPARKVSVPSMKKKKR